MSSRITALALSFLVLFSSFFSSFTVAYADLSIGEEAKVAKVRFQREYQAGNVVGGTVNILGEHLKGLDVKFEIRNNYVSDGIKAVTSSDGLLAYQLDVYQAREFTGRLLIGTKEIDLKPNNLPAINSIKPSVINQDTHESLTIAGSNFLELNSTADPQIKITAEYGKGVNRKLIKDNSATHNPNQANYTKITDDKIIINPSTAFEYGSQNIIIKKEDNSGPVATSIQFQYSDVFSIIKGLNIDNVEVNPNAASKGDSIELISRSADGSAVGKLFNQGKYEVYFLDQDDSDYDFQDYKKSPKVAVSRDKTRLTVAIPNNQQFNIGTKRIVIVEENQGKVIARFDVGEAFTLLDANNKPQINIINPDHGSDEGENVQIIAKNIFDIKLTGFANQTPNQHKIKIADVLSTNSDHDIEVIYDVDRVTYKNKAVQSLKRTIKTIIGSRTTNQLVNGKPKYSQVQSDDYLFLRTGEVSNIDADPVKDVVIEVLTEVVMKDGKKYSFKQKAIKPKAYTFAPNSIQPTVTAVSPNIIQLDKNKAIKSNSLIAISGENFFVDKYLDNTGKLHINYPLIALQQTETLGKVDAELFFDKNKGTITINGVEQALDFEMVVLNEKNQIVDGSVGNNLGTRIVLTIPKGINIANAGKKNLQVINTKKNASKLGLGFLLKDSLEFVLNNDSPVIQTVNPPLMTVDAQDTIIISGYNFKEGVKVYIDGIDVGDVERSISNQGDSSSLTFKAPHGRETETYITVVNPDGGTDSVRFSFIVSNNQDPTIKQVSPNKGTGDTITMISGDNFLKADASVKSTKGFDAYRLIGSRILVDGKDVNQYNRDSEGAFAFLPYIAPTNQQKLFNIFNQQLVASPFAENAIVIAENSDEVYTVNKAADGSPQFFDGKSAVYIFRYRDGKYLVYDSQDELLDEFNLNNNSLSFKTKGKKFKIIMDNKLFRPNYDNNRELEAAVANYYQSVVLYDSLQNNYYIVHRLLDGSVRLSDGQNIYSIRAEGQDLASSKLVAYDSQNKAYSLEQTADTIKLQSADNQIINLKMLTVYKVDAQTKAIVGNRVEVLTKTKIYLTFPSLNSGIGFKNITVVNPDTRSATLEKAFYYTLPSTHPIISEVKPNLGSVSGGYWIKLKGKDFSEGMQVYFDSEEVAAGDINISLDGKEAEIKVPLYPYDIAKLYGVNKILVPLTVVNPDGGSFSLRDGFTYVQPASVPKINNIILSEGSTMGGELVEITGTDFRFFEPYINLGGSVGYEKGIDKFTNLNGYLPITKAWDNLLSKRKVGDIDLWEEKPMPNGKSYAGYNYYYDSPILPKVYFADREAKIVEFDKGYIRVITPPQTEGKVDVVVINNDAGTSNSVEYNYSSSKPSISKVSPERGARYGNQKLEIEGSQFVAGDYYAYQNDDATKIELNKKVQALVQFGDNSNKNVELGEKNDGRISANRAIVRLAGGMTVNYNGKEKSFEVEVVEGGKTYKRKFSNYSGQKVYFPLAMLKAGAEYYKPLDYPYSDLSKYNSQNDYELVEVELDQRKHKLNVTRGFAPQTRLYSKEKILLKTPSYHTMEKVNLYLQNPDGGVASSTYQYTNPQTRPVIIDVQKHKVIEPNSGENKSSAEVKFIESSVQGGMTFQIIGRDFREGVSVKLGDTEAEVLSLKQNDNQSQTLVVKVPKVDEALADKKLAIIVENNDTGIANSTNSDNLDSDKRLIYFVYRKPLSLPIIKEVKPNKISAAGAVRIKIYGENFRKGIVISLGDVDKKELTPTSIDRYGQVLTVDLPKNLNVGKMSIQASNTDFGMANLKDALEIISDPQVDSRIYDQNNQLLNKVFTTGGQKIILKGKNFQEGAKVYLGGKRIKLDSGQKNDKQSKAIRGFYRDNREYLLEGATEVKTVRFINSENLELVTPAVTADQQYAISVINPDGGLSADSAMLNYGVPVPAKISQLKASVVNSRYIKLEDYAVERSKYYEIYFYYGSKRISELRRNQYHDFSSLGTTVYVPYKISRLPALQTINKSDKLYFMVKAVNQYGSSQFSNIAYLDYKKLRKLTKFAKDTDGKIGDLGNKAYRYSKRGNTINILFSKENYLSGTSFNFKTREYQNSQKIVTLMPARLVRNNRSDMQLYSDLVDLNYKPSDFNSSQFNTYASNNDGLLQFTCDWSQNSDTASVLSQLPRNLRPISPVVQYRNKLQTSRGNYTLNGLQSAFTASFNINSKLINNYTNNYQVYYFNPQSRTWQKLNSNYNQQTGKVYYNVSSQGYYLLTSSY